MGFQLIAGIVAFPFLAGGFYLGARIVRLETTLAAIAKAALVVTVLGTILRPILGADSSSALASVGLIVLIAAPLALRLMTASAPWRVLLMTVSGFLFGQSVCAVPGDILNSGGTFGPQQQALQPFVDRSGPEQIAEAEHHTLRASDGEGADEGGGSMVTEDEGDAAAAKVVEGNSNHAQSGKGSFDEETSGVLVGVLAFAAGLFIVQAILTAIGLRICGTILKVDASRKRLFAIAIASLIGGLLASFITEAFYFPVIISTLLCLALVVKFTDADPYPDAVIMVLVGGIVADLAMIYVEKSLLDLGLSHFAEGSDYAELEYAEDDPELAQAMKDLENIGESVNVGYAFIEDTMDEQDARNQTDADAAAQARALAVAEAEAQARAALAMDNPDPVAAETPPVGNAAEAHASEGLPPLEAQWTRPFETAKIITGQPIPFTLRGPAGWWPLEGPFSAGLGRREANLTLIVRSEVGPTGNTAHAKAILQQCHDEAPDWALTSQARQRFADADWAQFEFTSPDDPGDPLVRVVFTHAGSRGAYLLEVRAPRSALNAHRAELGEIIASFRFPPDNWYLKSRSQGVRIMPSRTTGRAARDPQSAGAP